MVAPARPNVPLYQQLRPAAAPAETKQTVPSEKQSMENMFGRNIVGIVAAVLVFVGLVFLGYLVVPLLSEEVKVIAMFALSAALTVAGYLLNRRFSNNFTKSFLGTGCGAFFISIMVTHLYFNFLGEIAAFSLLLVWLIACLFLTRHTQSLFIGILAHVGMVASVAVAYFGYAAGIDDSKLVLLLIISLFLPRRSLWAIFCAARRCTALVCLPLSHCWSAPVWRCGSGLEEEKMASVQRCRRL